MSFGVSAEGLIVLETGETTPGRRNGDYLQFRGQAVHRLVLAIFDPAGYHPVWMDRCDHINRVTTDNRACNLRWSNSVLNGLNSSRAGGYAIRATCYVVQFRVMGSRHAASCPTVQEAIYLVHHCNRTTFRALETLYKFLAAHDAPAPATPHKWLAAHFPAPFLRRLSGLPTKKPAGRRRTNN